jgi:hypothetical protein
VAGRQDGAAVLAGDGDHLGARVDAAHHVAQRLHLQVARAGAIQRLGALLPM